MRVIYSKAFPKKAFQFIDSIDFMNQRSSLLKKKTSMRVIQPHTCALSFQLLSQAVDYKEITFALVVFLSIVRITNEYDIALTPLPQLTVGIICSTPPFVNRLKEHIAKGGYSVCSMRYKDLKKEG